MRVKQLAETMGVTADTVRHYTKLGILEPDKDPRNGYKVYGEADQSRLHFALRARQLGFTVEEIQQIVQHAARGVSPCPLVRTLVQERLAELRESLKEAQQLYRRMEEALEQWRHLPDGEPNGNSVCTLIESWNDREPLPTSAPQHQLTTKNPKDAEEHEQQ